MLKNKKEIEWMILSLCREFLHTSCKNKTRRKEEMKMKTNKNKWKTPKAIRKKGRVELTREIKELLMTDSKQNT